MSQQLLSGPTSSAVGDAAAAIARLIAAPPGPDVLAALRTATWPMRDPESLRGLALLEESALAGESAQRLRLDHARLFTGGPDRPAVAPPGVPDAAAPALARLHEEIRTAGVVLPVGAPPGVEQALRTFGLLLAVTPDDRGDEPARWRRELLTEHLQTWGARCLTRAQLGAQTFLYQGAATLGLGLLRWAADEH